MRAMKGRGALEAIPGRHAVTVTEAFDDGWPSDVEPPPPLRTTVTEESARSIISRNQSPDIPFDQSINPYRGCEHGCIYCYARPSHSWLELSPGLDFESKLYAKTNAAELLRRELARPGHVPTPINLGANTDPYQPIERHYRLTRQILEVLLEHRHPLTLITKSARVEADLDLLTALARQQLVMVFLSVSTLDNALAAKLEPRASAPHRRIQAIHTLNAAGVPCGVLVAPIIPALSDVHLEQILEQAAAGGARHCGYTLVRLPWEVRPLFEAWLQEHYPQRAAHILSLISQMREGKLNDPRFGSRMRGFGVFAELLRQRFRKTARRLGYLTRQALALDTTQFRVPPAAGTQLPLF